MYAGTGAGDLWMPGANRQNQHSARCPPMSHPATPLLIAETADRLRAAQAAGQPRWTDSFDLGRSWEEVVLDTAGWYWRGRSLPWPGKLRPRTIYHFDGADFVPVARFSDRLIKLVPTEWQVPTFEIDGIKMLPTKDASPLEDARRKVALVAPAGRQVLDCCGGLGYFAAMALEAGAARIVSFEKDPDVLWLRTLNPWSPDPAASAERLDLLAGDVAAAIGALADASFDVVLHDPPRFGIAGELYALAFYRELARVLRPSGRLFHYTGRPNRLGSGRDLPHEVARRLEQAGLQARPALDGVFATRRQGRGR